MAGETGYAASFLVSGHEILKNRSSCSTQGNAYTSNQHPIGLGVFQVCSGAVTEPQLTAVAPHSPAAAWPGLLIVSLQTSPDTWPGRASAAAQREPLLLSVWAQPLT